MGDEPGTQGCGDNGGVFGLVHEGELLLVGEAGFYVLEEGEWEGVPLVDVRDVGVKTSTGVVVGEEADVFEFPAED